MLKSNSDGQRTPLAKGVAEPLGTGTWHHFSLTLHGPQISASVDGHNLTAVTDASYPNGQAGLGVAGYDTDQFDNLEVTPVK